MLASALITRFVRDPARPSDGYLRLYAEVYGSGVAPSALPETCPPPGASQVHARTMAQTLVEWARRLDQAGIQIHQEGAIARFLGAETAPVYGRHPGAAAARRKTVGFYRAVLEAAVQGARARTWQIPAAPYQGAMVALVEAQASAQAFHESQAALTASWPSADERPELAHLHGDRASLEGAAGRAIAMHTTAMAEAIGVLHVAEGGDWLRVAATAQGIAAMGAGLIVGVEVPPGPMAQALVANLDPQHGGGVFGLGCTPVGALAACDAACQIVQASGVMPRTTRYVTPRMDPDALVAAMVLSGRLPLPLVAANGELLTELATLDSSEPTSTSGWQPGPPSPQTVADHPRWGALVALCFQFSQGGDEAPSLADLEGAVLAIFSEIGPRMARECERIDEAWEGVDGLISRLSLFGPVAFGTDLPVGAATWGAVYSKAPVGVLLAQTFPFRGRSPGPKYTVATSRELGPQGPAFHAAFRRKIGALESGWGGAATITGSPFGGPSALMVQIVLDAAMEAAREVGISGASAGATPAPRSLR